VVLNEALKVVIAQGYETIGEVVMLKKVLEEGDRALVISHADGERVARLGGRRSHRTPLARSIVRLAPPAAPSMTCPNTARIASSI
jgi:hypothetical protein